MAEVLFFSNECGLIKRGLFEIGKQIYIPKNIDYIVIDIENHYDHIEYVKPQTLYTINRPSKIKLRSDGTPVTWYHRSVLKIENPGIKNCTVYSNNLASELRSNILNIDTVNTDTSINISEVDTILICLFCKNYRSQLLKIPYDKSTDKIYEYQLSEKIEKRKIDLHIKSNGTLPIQPENIDIEIETECSNNVADLKYNGQKWELELKGSIYDIFSISISAPYFEKAFKSITLEEKFHEIEIKLNPKKEIEKLDEIIDILQKDSLQENESHQKYKKAENIIDEYAKNFRLNAMAGVLFYSIISKNEGFQLLEKSFSDDLSDTSSAIPIYPRDFSIGFSYSNVDSSRRFNFQNYSIRYFIPFGIYMDYELAILLGQNRNWVLNLPDIEIAADILPLPDPEVNFEPAFLAAFNGGIKIYKTKAGPIYKPGISLSYFWADFSAGAFNQVSPSLFHQTAHGMMLSGGIEIPINKSIICYPSLTYIYNLKGSSYRRDCNREESELIIGKIRDEKDITESYLALELIFDFTLDTFVKDSN
ncbi:MAG: hypothetical protein ACLFSQ_07020 [Candidatus Zixiibacteriota bacterium]